MNLNSCIVAPFKVNNQTFLALPLALGIRTYILNITAPGSENTVISIPSTRSTQRVIRELSVDVTQTLAHMDPYFNILYMLGRRGLARFNVSDPLNAHLLDVTSQVFSSSFTPWPCTDTISISRERLLVPCKYH